MESCTLKPSLVQGTTSLAPTLVKAEVNLTTGATLDPPGTTAALLVITPLCLFCLFLVVVFVFFVFVFCCCLFLFLSLSFLSSWDYCSPPGNTLLLRVTICFLWDTSETFFNCSISVETLWDTFPTLCVQLCYFSWDGGAGDRRRRWSVRWKVSFGNIWLLLFMLPIDNHAVACHEVAITRCDSLDENYTWCPVINVEGEGRPVIASSPLSTYFPHHRHDCHWISNAIITQSWWFRTLHELQ